MSDDICGYEPTTTGHPCQHPADRCPVPSHSDAVPDGGDPQGRDSKFQEERVERVLEVAENGTTVEGCARAAGIGVSTLYDWQDEGYVLEWRDEKPEFSEAFNRARAKGEQRLLRSEDVPSTFVLERSYGYTKKTELEHSGEIDGFEFTIQYDDD